MLERAIELGVTVHINSQVSKLDFNEPPRVTVNGGKVYTADLVVGCDGLRSVCREALVGHPDPPYETGDIAYRILVPAEVMKPHPELAELLDNPAINVWMGPGGHVVCYLLKGGNLYNIVLMYLPSLSAPDFLEMRDLTNVIQCPRRSPSQRQHSKRRRRGNARHIRRLGSQTPSPLILRRHLSQMETPKL